MNKKKEQKKKAVYIFTLFSSLSFVNDFDETLFSFFFFSSEISSRLRLRFEVAVFLIDLIFLARRVVDFLFFLISFRLFFRRDFFLCVDFDFRHVNEIRSFVVIRSTIVRIFFIYFVNETRSITLCSLTSRNDDV